METRGFWRLEHLSDAGLRRGLDDSVAGSCRIEARIVAHLAEVDRRKLYLKDGFSCLYKYCLNKLGLSESESFHRMTAARIARRFPIVFELLDQRKIHLSGLVILRKFLTPDNHRELLAAACGKTKAQVEELLAMDFPGATSEDRIRRLRARIAPLVASPPKPSGTGGGAGIAGVARGASNANDHRSPRNLAQNTKETGSRFDGAGVERARPERGAAEVLLMDPKTGEVRTLPSSYAASGVSPRGTMLLDPEKVTDPSVRSGQCERPKTPDVSATLTPEPKAEVRYRIQFDASSRLKAKLDLARALSSHAIPRGELDVLVERALDAYIEKLQKRRFAKTERPRSKTTKVWTGEESASERPRVETSRVSELKPSKIRLRRTSRRGHLAHADRRTVAERCDLRCSFVAPDGQRCGEQAFLQFHHEQSWSRWGSDEANNLQLLCASHNRWLAERELGADFVARRIAEKAPRSDE